MAKEKDEFKLTNLPPEVNDPEISKDDFKLVQVDAKIHDQKFQTKPTTFLKDCVRRFSKNKSSVVATFILGFLFVLSVIIPVACKTSEAHQIGKGHEHPYIYLEPKLFPAGTGFWDGTKKLTGIPVDTSDPDPANWKPSSAYVGSAISNLEIAGEEYVASASKYGKDGYVEIGYTNKFPAPIETSDGIVGDYMYYSGKEKIASFDFSNSLKITNFDVYDEAKLQASAETIKTFPDGYNQGKCALALSFKKNIPDPEDGSKNILKTFDIYLTEYKSVFNIGNGEDAIDVSALFNTFYESNYSTYSWTDKVVENPSIEIRVLNENTAEETKNECVLVKSIEIKADDASPVKDAFESLSFRSGNEVLARSGNDAGIWSNKSDVTSTDAIIYLAKAVVCSFTYDTYEAAFGTYTHTIPFSTIEDAMIAKVIDFDPGLMLTEDGYIPIPGMFKCEILDPKKSPIAEPFTQADMIYDVGTGVISSINAKVFRYKADYKLDSMPIFLMGTDKQGYDMFIYVFEGLRTSLLLGIATTIVCFIFGLIWGSVAGYFGGNVDLIMERFTDILSGVPWIVVMTLAILKLGSTFFTFALALCLTGWIGTAAITRTQFYRFRSREYVLASRTLGASHGRLIAKHILPNAMGTIITSAVLMVPSVIFSEATISFLGLGFQNLSSLGVILNDNQTQILEYPYLLIFPSVVIALLMISFNLFGNGLRDAVNPSLKGEGE